MRRKNRAAGHAKSDLTSWYFKERRIVLTCARGLTNGRFESEGAAMRACQAALARAGLEGRHTTEAIRDRLRTESRRMGKPPRAYWTATEDRVIDRLARAMVRHKYPDATAAAHAFQKVMARHKRHFPRTDVAVAARVGARALEFGRKQIHVIWTPEEWRLIRELARGVSSGRFREVRQAAREFAAEMARRRKGWAPGERPIPVRTIAAIDRKLRHTADVASLAWGFRDWSPEEDRVVDRFIGRYSKGKFRSFRSAARACQDALRRLDAARQRHPSRGRPYGRSLSAIKQHLRERAAKRGVPMHLFRRWRGVEQDVAARYAGLYVAGGGRPNQLDIAYALQRELRGLGYRRTVTACKAELRRARLRMAGLL